MGSRRATALGLMGVALTTIVVIYDSAPAPGAPHTLNGTFMFAAGAAFIACFAWFLFDPAVATLYERRFGIPFPIATCVVADDHTGAKLTLSGLARIDEQVECQVIVPGRRHVSRRAPKPSTNEISFSYPDDFDTRGIADPLAFGTYRVRWRPFVRRQGGDEFEQPIARASFRFTKPSDR